MGEVSALSFGEEAMEMPDGEELEEQVGLWNGDELPDSQEPIGGRRESRAIVDKMCEGGSSGSSRGRPSKMAQLMRTSKDQVEALSQATKEGGEVVAQAIRDVAMQQILESKHARELEDIRRKREREEDREEAQKTRDAMLEGLRILAHALGGDNGNFCRFAIGGSLWCAMLRVGAE